MKTYGWFKTEFENAQNSFDYKLEGLKLCFVEKVLVIMEKRGVSCSELAKKMGTSNAYITKLFKGKCNLTLKNMFNLVEAIDCSISIDVVEN